MSNCCSNNCACDSKNDTDILCNCLGVTVGEVKSAIKDGATTVDLVGDKTGAGTGCGACKDDIQKLIDAMK